MTKIECIDCAALPMHTGDPGEYAPELRHEFRPDTLRKIDSRSTPRRPRCATHYRSWKKEQDSKRHETYVGKTYGLEPGEYEALLAYQGGKCAICRRATGKARRLAVDHDHETGEVRGLLCKPCNRTILSHGGETLQRAVAYLELPPRARLRAAQNKESA
jgi:hypothetical protein